MSKYTTEQVERYAGYAAEHSQVAAAMLRDYAALLREREVRTDSAGYTLGPVSDGGMDPRERVEATMLEGLRERIKCAWYDHDEDGLVSISMKDARILVEQVLVEVPIPASARVPEEMKIPKLGPDQEACDGFVYEYGFSEGFNACRIAMLAAPKPEKE